MEEERLRMREHVMNEVSNFPLPSWSVSLRHRIGIFDVFFLRWIWTETDLCPYKSSWWLQIKRSSWSQTAGRWVATGFSAQEEKKKEFKSILPKLASWSDAGAEPGLHRGGDEGVWGAPSPAGARPQPESSGPPETERRAGETAGTVERTENWAATGTRRQFAYLRYKMFLYFSVFTVES